jgi:hypothetical protein
VHRPLGAGAQLAGAEDVFVLRQGPEGGPPIQWPWVVGHAAFRHQRDAGMPMLPIVYHTIESP